MPVYVVQGNPALLRFDLYVELGDPEIPDKPDLAVSWYVVKRHHHDMLELILQVVAGFIPDPFLRIKTVSMRRRKLLPVRICDLGANNIYVMSTGSLSSFVELAQLGDFQD